ncbi:MAG: thioesterase [Desulfuromonadales bacterium GWD2_61_12]|nr:MAG: thioesterase [Desulfuromonadales bacterium GWC2_61_20]OGR34064.1 MAG: thioesterase [Desulfuromonadales bacterium GWD2_61_12]HAD03495.1 thioesterase [Desulfuromonas sp.]HBT82792.1 thioesterase [Desulfuromonas sp.]
MKDSLRPGLTFTHRYVVPENKTVPYVFETSDKFQAMPKVFATAFMVGLMEWACMEALGPYLEEGERTVGTMINTNHCAATPPGMAVTVEVTLVAVEGQRTEWKIVARDEVEIIGEATHQRFTVNKERFERSLQKKLDKQRGI